jgi:hypothetical protein
MGDARRLLSSVEIGAFATNGVTPWRGNFRLVAGFITAISRA